MKRHDVQVRLRLPDVRRHRISGGPHHGFLLPSAKGVGDLKVYFRTWFGAVAGRRVRTCMVSYFYLFYLLFYSIMIGFERPSIRGVSHVKVAGGRGVRSLH